MKTIGPTLTISFQNDQIFIGDVVINLEPRTIYNGIIFKPTEIIAKLSDYIKATNLKKTKITVYLPTTINPSPTILPFFVLQYTLVLTKAGIPITKITTTNQTTNLLSLLHPTSRHSPKLWLFITLIALGTFGTIIWIKHQEALAYYTKLTNKEAICKQTNISYEKQYKETNALKKTIRQLKEKQTKTQDFLRNRHNPKHLLSALAHQTPTTIWLTSVKFNQKSAQAKTKNNLSIEGTSFNTKAISQFIKNLSDKTTGISHPILIHVGKEKGDRKTLAKKLYHFIIEGIVKE